MDEVCFSFGLRGRKVDINLHKSLRKLFFAHEIIFKKSNLQMTCWHSLRKQIHQQHSSAFEDIFPVDNSLSLLLFTEPKLQKLIQQISNDNSPVFSSGSK